MATIFGHRLLSDYVIQEYPTGVTPTYPRGSPKAESNPADVSMRSGLNSFIIGKKTYSHA